LPDQLIQSLFGNRAVALVVYISPVSSARRPPIDEHAKSDGRPSRCRSHDDWNSSVGVLIRGPLAERGTADISRCVHATCPVCHRYIRYRRALAHGRFAIVEPLK
jgi:hypothetical protein